MQSKKLLSVCAAIVLLCTCIMGMLAFSANAAEPIVVTYYVTDTEDTPNNKYSDLQKALMNAQYHTPWKYNEELVIEIQTSTPQTVHKDPNDILFGIPTIFREDDSRLPITIQGGTLTCNASITGNVACANSYTFKDMAFDIGTKGVKFFAGSGEVVFDNVNLGASCTSFFHADNCTAEAFFNWSDDNKAKNSKLFANPEKSDEKISLVTTSIKFYKTNYNFSLSGVKTYKTSMRFHESEYPGYISVVGYSQDFKDNNGKVGSTDLACELIIDHSTVAHIGMRNLSALSPVRNISLKMSSSTGKSILGMGRTFDNSSNSSASSKTSPFSNQLLNEYPSCNLNIDLSNSDFTSNTYLVLGAKFKGNVDIKLNTVKLTTDNTVLSCLFGANITGNVNMESNNLTIPTQYFPIRNSIINGNSSVTFDNGGSYPTTYAVMGSIINGNHSNIFRNVTFSKNFNLAYTSDITGTLENDFSGTVLTSAGSITCVATAGAGDEIGNFVRTFRDGTSATVSKTFFGNYDIKNYTTNIYGGSFESPYSGCAESSSFSTVTNNIYSGTFGGSYYGSGKSSAVTTITNNIYGGTFQSYYYGSGNTSAKFNTLNNNFYGGTFKTNSVYGTSSCGGAVDTTKEVVVNNTFAKVTIPGTNTISSGINTNQNFCGTNKGSAANIDQINNTISAGSFARFFATGWNTNNADLAIQTTITGGSFKEFNAVYCDEVANPNYVGSNEYGRGPAEYVCQSNNATISGGTFSVSIALVRYESTVGVQCKGFTPIVSIEGTNLVLGNSAKADVTSVKGTVTLGSGASIQADSIDGNLTLKQGGDKWANGHAYLTCENATNYSVTATDKNSTRALKINAPNGGFEVVGGGIRIYASFTLDDFFSLNAAFPKDWVDANMANGEFHYSFRYSNENNPFKSGTITTSSEVKNGYYVVDLGIIDANRAFDTIVCEGTLHSRTTSMADIAHNAGKNENGALSAEEQVLFCAIEDYFHEIKNAKNDANGHYDYSENKVIEGVRKEVVAGIVLDEVPTLKSIFANKTVQAIGLVMTNKGAMGFEFVIKCNADPTLQFAIGDEELEALSDQQYNVIDNGNDTYTVTLFLKADILSKEFTLAVMNGNETIETICTSLEELASIIVNHNAGGDAEFDNDEENDSFTDDPAYKEVFPAVVLQMIQAIKHYKGVDTLPQMPDVKNELNSIPTIDSIQDILSSTEKTDAEKEAALRDIVVRYMKLQLTFPYTPVFAEGETKIYDYNTVNGNELLSYVEGQLYGGVPYMQATNGNMYRLLKFYNYADGVGTLNFAPIVNNSRLDYSRSSNTYFNAGSVIFGNSCASSTFWASARISNEIKGCWCATMVPAAGNGFLPVGDYNFDEVNDEPKEILKISGNRDKVISAYSLVKPGDILLSNGHAMMALSAPYQNSNDEWVILIGEQIAVRTTTSGAGKLTSTGVYGLYGDYNFDYRHQGAISEYTFEKLSESYIPIRVPELEPTHDKYLVVEATDITATVTMNSQTANIPKNNSNALVSVEQLSTLQLASNYFISDVTFTVNKNGTTKTYFGMTSACGKVDENLMQKHFNASMKKDLTFFDEDGNILTLYQFEEILADCESISIECLVSSGTTATFNFQTKQN